MRTNSKEVKNKVRQYIIDTVYDNNENNFKSFSEAATFLKNDFIRVADYKFNLKRLPNNQERFLDYLQGAPFYFPVYNDEVETFLNSLGINPQNKKYSSDKMWNLFSLLIFRELNY